MIVKIETQAGWAFYEAPRVEAPNRRYPPEPDDQHTELYGFDIDHCVPCDSDGRLYRAKRVILHQPDASAPLRIRYNRQAYIMGPTGETVENISSS